LITSEAIRTLEYSASAAKGDIDRVKNTYRFSRSDEGQCCQAKSKELSDVLERLSISESKALRAKKALKTVTAAFEGCKK